MASTGYFAVPGDDFPPSRSPIVHFVRDGKPLCGAKFRGDAEFQWCCSHFEYSYVECKSCRGIYRRMVLAELGPK